LLAEVDDRITEFLPDHLLVNRRNILGPWWLKPEEIEIRLFAIQYFDLHLFQNIRELNIALL